MCARRRSHFLFVSAKKSNQRKRRPHWLRPSASLRATCGAHGRGALSNSLRACSAPFKHRQRVRSRCGCILRCTRSPRPLRSSAHPEGRETTTRAIAALGPGFCSRLVEAGLPAMSASEEQRPHRGQARSRTRSSRPSAAMARGDFTSPLAVSRSAGRGAGAAAQHAALRALTCCGCLSGVSEANKASSAAPPRARASQVARSKAEGHGQRGRLFFGYFLLARQKKVTAPPGAHPGQRHIQPTIASEEAEQPLTPALSFTRRGRKP